MNICLTVPPSTKRDKIPERVYGCTFSYYQQPELPILYVAALLEREGHSVTFRDFTDDNSWDSFGEFVTAHDYDAYIFHTVLLAESSDIRAGRFIAAHSRAKIIYFGPHPTLEPQKFLFDERCTVARGEAEYVISDLVKALGSGTLEAVKGISYVKDGRLHEHETYGIIKDLDSLPVPARHHLRERDRFANPKLKARPVTLVLTSRGCSFRCYYCVPNAISWARELEWKRFHAGKKPPVTLRSPENIAAEFAAVKSEGYKAVSIIDDMFLFGGKERVLALCAGLKAVGLPFGGLARCDLILDEDIVAGLAEAGCQYIDLGIESLDQGVLDDIKKDIDVRKVESAIKLLNKHGIEPKPNIMFGASPYETRDTIDHTIKTISRYPVNYCMFAIATPFPGTEFSDKARSEGWAVVPEINDLENNLSPTDKSLISYPHLGKKDLETAVKKANRLFYLSPRRVWFMLRKLRSFKDLKDLITTGWKVIK